jgi:hypothetical protein
LEVGEQIEKRTSIGAVAKSRGGVGREVAVEHDRVSWEKRQRGTCRDYAESEAGCVRIESPKNTGKGTGGGLNTA